MSNPEDVHQGNATNSIHGSISSQEIAPEDHERAFDVFHEPTHNRDSEVYCLIVKRSLSGRAPS